MMKNKNSMVHDSAAVPDSHTLQHPRPCDPQRAHRTRQSKAQEVRRSDRGFLRWIP